MAGANALLAQAREYTLVTRIALALSEQPVPQQKKSSALPVVLGIIAGLLVVGGIVAGVLLYLQPKKYVGPDAQIRNELVLSAPADVQYSWEPVST